MHLRYPNHKGHWTILTVTRYQPFYAFNLTVNHPKDTMFISEFYPYLGFFEIKDTIVIKEIFSILEFFTQSRIPR